MVEAPSAPASSGTAAGRYAAAASLTAAPGKRAGAQAKPVSLDEIELSDTDRTRTGFAELDRVLGSGVVRGSLVLVGGDRADLACRRYMIMRLDAPGLDHTVDRRPHPG